MKFKSQFLQQASGSLGGVTYSHNSGGMYTRQRSIPTDPATSFQTIVRNSMASLANIWGLNLTAAQRAAWDVYAQNVPVRNVFGDNILISGLNHYVRSNMPRVQLSLTRIDDAPTVYNLGEFGTPSFAIDATGGTIDVSFDDTDAWIDEDEAYMLVMASRPQNDTINFFKGPYRQVAPIAGSSTTPPTTPTSIALPFAYVAGQRGFAQFRVTRADGRLSNYFRTNGTAT